ncbi:MAG: efflux RND transporter permease subunit, partial [Bdellovibrionales bacterium]|nr:efflux RND transporter permease subunit [Bdellovibrionales bacterium]
LVPTIRLQLMKKAHKEQFRSPIEASIVRLEKLYIWTLSLFLKSRKFQLFSYFALVGSLVFLVGFILPLLPKEIIGLPDTDWIVLGLNTQGHSRLGQMEDLTAKDEIRIMQKFGESVSYTFTQVQGPNRSTVMARLKDKSEMKKVLDEFKQIFQNSPQVHYFIIPWNPSELPIPDPPHFQASIQGGTAWERLETAHRMHSVLESSQLFDRVWQNPSYEDGKSILIRPHLDQWAPLAKAGVALLPYDLTDISRVASQGRFIGQMVLNNRSYRINLSYPQGRIKTVEDLKSFPLGVKSKIIPLGALAQIDIEKGEAPRFRKDHLDTVLLSAKLDQTSSPDIKAIGESAMNLLNDWLSNNKMTLEKMNVQFEDAQFELNDALKQLSWAIGLSILLVFVTMIIQLGSIVSSLLVLVSIPLGLIGVISSLYLFNSTLSLNSALGIILLNGIAVSNSIILVDFINKLIKSGKEVHSATLEAARTRLRPILMTSLTTSIGMLPIAFGLGEGGSVLQPLGIAVSGGLWISMCLTLYTVPALQFAYWNWRQSQGSTYLPSDILLSTKLKG